MSKINPLINYEKHIENLENIINALESGELSLDEALKQYEQGIHLVRQCQQALENAEQKIQILTQKDHQEILEPFEHKAERAIKNDDETIPF